MPVHHVYVLMFKLFKQTLKQTKHNQQCADAVAVHVSHAPLLLMLVQVLTFYFVRIFISEEGGREFIPCLNAMCNFIPTQLMLRFPPRTGKEQCNICQCFHTNAGDVFSCKCSCDAATFKERCNAAYSNANRFDISPVNAVAENRCVRPMSAISISMCSSFCFEIFNFWDFDFTSFVPILCQRLTPCLWRIQALIFNA